MINSNHLKRLQSHIKNDFNFDDNSEIDMNVSYIIENIKENLEVVENKFSIEWDEIFSKMSEGSENRKEILSKRISILMTIDDLVENMVETIERKIKEVNNG
jgi:hypothetical protein